MMSANLPESGTYYEFKKIAYGHSSSTRVLGIGGLGKEGLVLDAKRNMYREYPLMKGEAYANVSVDFKNTFLIFIHITEVVISADIVQLGRQIYNQQQQIFSTDYTVAEPKTQINFDYDTVIIFKTYTPIYGMIIDSNCLTNGELRCDVKGFETGQIKSFRTDNIYKSNGGFQNGYGETLRVGDEVAYYRIKSSDKTRKTRFTNYRAFIYGFRGESAIISITNLNGKHIGYRTVHYNQLKPIK